MPQKSEVASLAQPSCDAQPLSSKERGFCLAEGREDFWLFCDRFVTGPAPCSNQRRIV